MILFPHAKINLGLDILRKRPDGYHDIATVMVPTGWEDVLELNPADDGKTELITTGRPVACPPEKNLVMKAFRAMEAATGGIPPTKIGLHKVIPDGAGLGGGSADAAFTLRGLNILYNLGMPDAILCDIAATIGADCPFFIADKPMLCTGTGTTMTPIEIKGLKGLTLAIVKPLSSIGTAEAYSNVTPHIPDQPLELRIADPISGWQQTIANDFEKSVFPAHPEIESLKQEMLSLGAAYSAMSGSGSAVFGLFSNQDPAILSDKLKSLHPDFAIHCGLL